jgi:poly [ADP-ribose] polymerase 10/14/15
MIIFHQVVRQYVAGCLDLAHQKGHQSIAIPAIGTGNLGYPKHVVAHAMYDEVYKFSQANPRTSLTIIRLVVYDKDAETIKVLLDQIFQKLSD